MAWALLASGVASGCAVHRAGFDEPLAMPASFPRPEDGGDDEAAAVPDRWWQAFGDEDLDALQQRALSGNFDLATFRDRLAAARAVVARERSFLFPTLDLSLFGEQTRRESAGFDPEDSYGGALIGSYEVDLWRRNASAAASAELARAVARARLQAAAITLSADVAATWYALVQQRGQARVLEAQIENNAKVLRVVRARFGGGVVRASDVLRQERLLESTREQRAVVRARIEVLEHALLVLTGRSPTATLQAATDELPPLPPQPSLGLPAELVQRRPDVRAAFHSIAQADAAVAVAVADRYPQVTIGLDAATVENQVVDLFEDWAATLSVDLFGPLIDAGRRRAEVRRAEAAKAERIDVYAQTILLAFQQVVDAVSRESARSEQIERIRRQLTLAHRTSERLNREYLNGDISYIDVLDAQTTEQRLQRDLLAARFQRIIDRIDLYRALAGGWEGVVPPGGDEVQGRSGDAAAQS